MRILAKAVLLGAVTIAAVTLAACRGDSYSTVVVSGRATFPPEYSGTLGEIVPVSNSSLQVLDLERGGDDQVVATAATTDDGAFAVTFPATSSAAVVVLGAVRVSGIVDVRNGSVQKDFNGVTDVACEAGVTAVGDGSISAVDLDSNRVAILEAAAAQVLQEIHVDFTNSDGSRSEAVRLVRERTNDGEILP